MAVTSLVMGGCVDHSQIVYMSDEGSGPEGPPESNSNVTGAGGSPGGVEGSPEGAGGSPGGAGGSPGGAGNGTGEQGPGNGEPEIVDDSSEWYIDGRNEFTPCVARYGTTRFIEFACHYPGPDTCALIEDGYERCLFCESPLGGHGPICVHDPCESLPAPLSGRPENLPPPGECVSTTEGRGKLYCETCTHDDGSATKTCEASTYGLCALLPKEDIDDRRTCFVCVGGEADVVVFCDPPTK